MSKISKYFSFVAVIITVVTVIWTSNLWKTDFFEISSVLISIIAALLGIILSVTFLRLTTRKYKSKIFISYSFNDNEIAELIRKRLREERFLLNIDEKNILVGENIKKTINKELEASSIVIILISKESSKSKFVEYEIRNSLELGKKILPVLIDKEATIPDTLKDIKYADLSNDKNKGIDQLVKSLRYNLN